MEINIYNLPSLKLEILSRKAISALGDYFSELNEETDDPIEAYYYLFLDIFNRLTDEGEDETCSTGLRAAIKEAQEKYL